MKSGQHIAVPSLKLSLKIKLLFIGKHSLQYFSPHFGKFSYSGHCGMLHKGSLPGAHGYLGKNIRRVILSCAVKKIRATFPAPDGMYTGYIAGDDDDSSFDSELDEAWREL